MNAEWWTVVVAAVGTLAGITSLTWQIVGAARDRGRVRVHLHLCVWAPELLHLIRREDGLWPMPKQPMVDASDAIELALVTVENSSKYPVSLTEVSLQTSPVSGSLLHRRKYTTATTPKSFTLDDPAFRIHEYAPHFRLEPYQQAEFLFDYWSAIEQFRQITPGQDVIVRGQSKVAGIRGTFLSSKTKRWQIPYNSITGLGWYLKVPFSHIVRRILAAKSPTKNLESLPLDYLADDIAKVVETANANASGPAHAFAHELSKYMTTFPETAELSKREWFWLTEAWKAKRGKYTTPKEDPGQLGSPRE